MDWIPELNAALDRKGYRLVVVVTPVNQFLIKEYASKDQSEIYLARIARARGALMRFLQENQIDYVDCSADVNSDGFVDLIHTNARGDEQVAEKMAGYIRLP
jgi:lysophospholipase L1-like esterase